MSDRASSPESRAAHVISQLYYYVAAVGGFGLFLGGTIATLFGVRQLILPREFETTHDALLTILHGLAFALPGLAIVWWHVRQARKREDRPAVDVFWGRALYFHLMALVALLFVVIGTVGLLFGLTDAVLAECDSLPRSTVTLEPADPAGAGGVVEPAHFCYPTRDESLTNAVDSSIFLVVSGPVFWWHLRQGRRLTAPPPDA